MKKFIFFFLVGTASGQLPVVKARTTQLHIRDGINLKTTNLFIDASASPDVYFVDIPMKPQKVTYITDSDSISFETQFGKNYDFIVLLNGKDTVHAQISCNFPKIVTYKSLHKTDTIPFTMRDNRIYFKTIINGSEALNTQLDLGAGGWGMVFLNHKATKKIAIDFDKSTILQNSDGRNETRLSSSNIININGMQWQGVEVVETRNMENYEDLIVGNGLFQGKIFEIDYDKKYLLIHEKMPSTTGFQRYDMLLDNGIRPVIEAAFGLDDQRYKDWFLFDTGNTGNGIIGNGYLAKNGLYEKFTKLIGFGDRKMAIMPDFHLGGNVFSKGVITLEKPNKNGSQYAFGGPIGNQILQSFNTIIDNQQGYIYLKTNNLHTTYANRADVKKKP